MAKKENRWMVMRLDTINHQIEIFETFDDQKEAMKHLIDVMEDDEEINDQNWYKKIIEDNCVSIYQLGYIFKKQLIYRYCVKHY